MKKTVLREYAKLIVCCGVNVQKGQEVFIYADLDQPEFVQMVVEEAYKLKAKKVTVEWRFQPLEKVHVRGISHITGGGFYENIPRSIPTGLCACIDKSAVRVLPIFDVIASWGKIPERDMYNTYNMGVGMSIVVPADEVDTALEILKAHGEDAYVIGHIEAGDEKVILK